MSIYVESDEKLDTQSILSFFPDILKNEEEKRYAEFSRDPAYSKIQFIVFCECTIFHKLRCYFENKISEWRGYWPLAGCVRCPTFELLEDDISIQLMNNGVSIIKAENELLSMKKQYLKSL